MQNIQPIWSYLLPELEEGAKEQVDVCLNKRLACLGLTTSNRLDYSYDYAALVNNGAYRWLLPLPELAGLQSTFLPFRNNKGWKKTANYLLQSAIRSPLKMLFIDRIRINSDREGALHRIAKECLNINSPLISLSSGTDGPEQKVHAIIHTSQGEAIALAKVAKGPLADSLLINEINILRLLASRSEVPAVLGTGHIHGRVYLIENYLPFSSFFNELSLRHMEFLLSLVGDETISALDSSIWNYLNIDLSVLPERYFPFGDLLISTIEWARSSLTSCVMPKTLMHGDFAPWNTSYVNDRLHVIDWEHAIVDGLPLLDIIHWQHHMQLMLLKENCIKSLSELLEADAEHPVMHYMNTIGLARKALVPMLVLYFCYRICRTATTNARYGYDPEGNTPPFRIWFEALEFLRSKNARK